MGTTWFCFAKLIAPKVLAIAQEKIAFAWPKYVGCEIENRKQTSR
jgi:hypothetical protein